ncbi:MAG: hypothetical protein Q7U75_19915 [Desulfobacterales bacterium]|nr:hypothetical protein [Desulfobacterales bacterium]
MGGALMEGLVGIVIGLALGILINSAVIWFIANYITGSPFVESLFTGRTS